MQSNLTLRLAVATGTVPATRALVPSGRLHDRPNVSVRRLQGLSPAGQERWQRCMAP
ncbi:MAG: hypothetical protein ACKO2P_18040 [Planctomycetota bacterium]